MHKYANILFYTDRDGRHHARINLPKSSLTEFVRVGPTYKIEKLMTMIIEALRETSQDDDPE